MDIDVAKVKELLEVMKSLDAVELKFQEGEASLHLKRAGGELVAVPAPAPAAAAAPTAPAATPAEPSEPPPAAKDDTAGLTAIKSPMVGTFYAASSPDAEPYVKVGDAVSADTEVCMIEAMKVFNPVTAGVSGVIKKIAVNNAEPVEFGQPLMWVAPA